MAIVKIISHGKNVAGTKNVLSYVLDLKKTGLDLCGTLGDISEDAITAKAAFLEFQRIRNLFGKDKNGRTYYPILIIIPGNWINPTVPSLTTNRKKCIH